MKKQLIISTMVVIIIALSGCLNQTSEETENDITCIDGEERIVNTEFIGGENNISILQKEMCHYTDYLDGYIDEPWVQFYEMKYTMNGEEYLGAYNPVDLGWLNWIKENTSNNCTILCWWDYGHEVIGYAERNAIATYASESLRDSVFVSGYLNDEELNEYAMKRGGWNSNATVTDIAIVLTSPNITTNETKEIIDKYNISYIFTDLRDRENILIIWYASLTTPELPLLDFYIENRDSLTGENTLIYKMWDEEVNVTGLELVYEDNYNSYYDDNIAPEPQRRIFKVNI